LHAYIASLKCKYLYNKTIQMLWLGIQEGLFKNSKYKVIKSHKLRNYRIKL
jgi:hypothetical protein